MRFFRYNVEEILFEERSGTAIGIRLGGFGEEQSSLCPGVNLATAAFSAMKRCKRGTGVIGALGTVSPAGMGLCLDLGTDLVEARPVCLCPALRKTRMEAK